VSQGKDSVLFHSTEGVPYNSHSAIQHKTAGTLWP
jgi:hypothetical protein